MSWTLPNDMPLRQARRKRLGPPLHSQFVLSRFGGGRAGPPQSHKRPPAVRGLVDPLQTASPSGWLRLAVGTGTLLSLADRGGGGQTGGPSRGWPGGSGGTPGGPPPDLGVDRGWPGVPPQPTQGSRGDPPQARGGTPGIGGIPQFVGGNPTFKGEMAYF